MADHGPTSQDRAMMEKAIYEARRAIDAGKAISTQKQET